MDPISIISLFPEGNVLAAGATLGAEHFAAICEQIRTAPTTLGTETMVPLDFLGIEDATPSYIKATVLALHQSGRLFAGVLNHDEATDVGTQLPKLNITVGILNASAAVQTCIHEVFALRGLGILSGTKQQQDRFESAVFLGELEPKIIHTLVVTSAFSNFTAPELQKQITEEETSVNGWNNRLAELHRHRLIRRKSEGRALRFFPLASTINIHGQVLS